MKKPWLNGMKNGTGNDSPTWIGHRPVLTGDTTTKSELLANYKKSLGLSPKHSFVKGSV